MRKLLIGAAILAGTLSDSMAVALPSEEIGHSRATLTDVTEDDLNTSEQDALYSDMYSNMYSDVYSRPRPERPRSPRRQRFPRRPPPSFSNCSGNFNISINGYNGVLSITDYGNGNIVGSVFGDRVQGQCNRGSITFTRYIANGRRFLTQHYQGWQQGRGYYGSMVSQDAGPGGQWSAY